MTVPIETVAQSVQSAKAFAAAIAALPLGAIGLAIGGIFINLIKTIGKNPAARDKVFILGILGFALTESVALFDLLVVFLILYS